MESDTIDFDPTQPVFIYVHGYNPADTTMFDALKDITKPHGTVLGIISRKILTVGDENGPEELEADFRLVAVGTAWNGLFLNPPANSAGDALDPDSEWIKTPGVVFPRARVVAVETIESGQIQTLPGDSTPSSDDVPPLVDQHNRAFLVNQPNTEWLRTEGEHSGVRAAVGQRWHRGQHRDLEQL